MRSPFQIESLIEWLQKQPPKRRYTFWNENVCLVTQYAKSLGLDGYLSIPASSRVGWNFYIASPSPHTFGAALERARRHALSLASPPSTEGESQ